MALKRFLKRAVKKAAGKVAAKKASTTAAKKAALLAKSKKAAKAKADFAAKKAREAKSTGVTKKPGSGLKAKSTIKVAPTKRKSTIKSPRTRSEAARAARNRKTTVTEQRAKATKKKTSKFQTSRGDEWDKDYKPYKTASAKGVKETPQQKQLRLRKTAKKTSSAPSKEKPTKKGIPFRTPLNKKPKQPALTGRVIKDTKGKLKNTSPTGNKRGTAKGTNPSQRVDGREETAKREGRRSAVESFDTKARKIRDERLRNETANMTSRERQAFLRKQNSRITAGKKRVGDAAESKVKSDYRKNNNISPGAAYQGKAYNEGGKKIGKTVGNRDSSNRLTGSKMRRLSEDMTQRKLDGKLPPIKQSTNTSNGPGIKANDTKLKPQGTPKKPKSVSAKKDSSYQGKGIDPAKSASVKKGAGTNAFKPSKPQSDRGRVVSNMPSAKQLQQGNTEQFKRFNGR